MRLFIQLKRRIILKITWIATVCDREQVKKEPSGAR